MGAELFHVDGRTDSHDEANSLLSPFREFAYKWTTLHPEQTTLLCGCSKQHVTAMDRGQGNGLYPKAFLVLVQNSKLTRGTNREGEHLSIRNEV